VEQVELVRHQAICAVLKLQLEGLVVMELQLCLTVTAVAVAQVVYMVMAAMVVMQLRYPLGEEVGALEVEVVM
jgi:hypothetical protein